MTMFVVQTFLLILIAFILGCLIGGLLRWMFGSPVREVETVAPIISQPAKELKEPAPPVAPPPVTKEPPTVAPEVVKPVTKPEIVPPIKPEPKPQPARLVSKPDDLKQIKGIGKTIEAKLNAAGISTFAQIAAWNASQAESFSEKLAFKGRIEREDWIGQAKTLASGASTEFSQRVEKGEVDSSKGKASKTVLGQKPSTLKKARAGGADDLTQVDGIGAALEKKLNAMGVFHLDQIAKWSDDNQTWIGHELGFPGRPQRENWVSDAAKLLESGKGGKSKRTGGSTGSRKTKIT